MKPILLFLCIFIGTQTTFSQDVMRLEDDLTTTFKLTKMMVIQTDQIRHGDLEGKDNSYYAKVKFGKRKFDIEIYKTATQKLMWASYPFLKGDDYFRKNTVRSNSFMEVYSLDREIAGGKENCEVTFYKGMKLSVMVSYSVEKNGQKALENLIMGSCDLE
jgi:hypothetical protein